MKLYATVASERATKGQGGNQRLQINLTVEQPNDPYSGFAELRLVKVESSNSYCLYLDGALIKEVKIKGEKQKGDYGLEACKKHKDFVSECLACNENNSY